MRCCERSPAYTWEAADPASHPQILVKRHKNVVETPEYVELSQEAGGSVHRLYEQLDMHMDPRNGKNEFAEVGGGRWIYADTAARVADAVPSATGGTRLVDAELGAFCDALTRITWKGIRRGWQNDFYFASGGRVMTLDGKEMPQQWFPVVPSGSRAYYYSTCRSY